VTTCAPVVTVLGPEPSTGTNRTFARALSSGAMYTPLPSVPRSAGRIRDRGPCRADVLHPGAIRAITNQVLGLVGVLGERCAANTMRIRRARPSAWLQRPRSGVSRFRAPVAHVDRVDVAVAVVLVAVGLASPSVTIVLPSGSQSQPAPKSERVERRAHAPLAVVSLPSRAAVAGTR
jgi:hypothetical protein